MSQVPRDSANYCYRHPNRQSYILCQRCGRTVCTDCQTQAAVGVQCPECIKEGRASTPRTKPAFITALRSGRQPVITYSIIALTVLVYITQIIPGSPVVQWGLYYPPLTASEPWRMITSVFLHSQGSIFHLLFNMYSLFVFGRILEPAIGRVRFVALYLITGFAGSVAVLWLAPMTAVLGASGAIFGLFGAFFVINRRLGGNNLQLVILLVLNLGIGFLVPGIAWQAHLGGLVVGALIGLVYFRTRRPDQRSTQILLVTGVFVALVVLTIVRVALF